MRIFRELAIVAFAGIALLYLFLPSLIPDFVPFVGWIDEGIATTILISAFQHWGIDVTGLFGTKEKQKNDEQLSDEVIITDRLSDGSEQKVRIPREVLERAMAAYQQEQAYQQAQQNQQEQYRR